MAKPVYAAIKEHLLDAIERGELKPGDQVASENQLALQFGVSRMTARRSLIDLSDAGFLIRTQGIGTFVADTRPMSSILKIRSIDLEIQQRGHVYSNQVLCMETLPATRFQAKSLGLEPDTRIYRSVIVHMENGVPVQLEDRLVNAGLIPDYMDQDFTHITPSAYLSRIAPLTEADHIVEAVMVCQTTAEQLAIETSEPCLKVIRRTFARQGIVSLAELIHPGSRYRLGGHLDFTARGAIWAA
jgi:GntR family histidine utilization transcriptional repressor